MARLTKGQRSALPRSAFAGPGRSFPIEDKAHARKAEQLAPRSERAGNISAKTEKSIVRKAEAKLGNSKGTTMAKKSAPAAFKAHEFKKGMGAARGDLAKGKPETKSHAKAPGQSSYIDHAVDKYGGGYNPGRGK